MGAHRRDDGGHTLRNAVIFHHPDGVDTSREKLMGRHAAGEGFLQGFVRYAGVEELFAETITADHHLDFAQRVREIAGAKRQCRRVRPDDYGDPETPSVLMLPSPDLSGFAWRRRQRGRTHDHSVCGVNHTVASPGVMEALTELVRAPLYEWDALICTSEASKSAIQHVIDLEGAYLEERFGVRPRLPVQMPVIPLGVDCARFETVHQAEHDRAHLRDGMGISDADIALLYFGRLSFHAKAHPLPMLVAAEETMRRTGRRVHMIMAGWFASDAIERAFRDAARNLAPSVRTVFLDGRDRDVRDRIWYAADIFVSLSDNVQETFGLTPIEAMAAGLPVIASDWDGYRETVRDGVDGILIPSWMPPAGAGEDLAVAIDTGIAGAGDSRAYDRYCGEVSQATSIDTAACIDAMVLLTVESDKRAAMGAAGRRRAREIYDWRHVVASYQALWGELDERRRRARSAAAGDVNTFIPQRPDPFAMFETYPSATLGDLVELQPVRGSGGKALAERLDHAMNSFAEDKLLVREDLETILAIVADTGGLRVKALAAKLDGRARPVLDRTIAWLAKMNLVRLRPEPSDKPGASHDEMATDERRVQPQKPDGTEPLKNAQTEEPSRSDDAPDGAATDGESDAASGGHGHGNSGNRDDARMRNMAAAAREHGDPDSAIEALERARVASPDDPAINRDLGMLLAARGQIADAESLLRKAIERESDDVAALNELGKILFLRGKQPEAVHIFRRSVRAAPDDGESRCLLGIALRRSGAFNESIRCLRIAAEIDADSIRARYHLGLAHESLGHFDEAARCYEDARRIEPDDRLVEAALLSAEAASVNRTRDVDRPRRVVFHLSSPSDFAVLKPVFNAIGDDCWPLISADETQIEAFAASIAVIVSGEPAAARRLTDGGQVVLLPAAAVRDAGQLAAARLADHAGALTLKDADVLIDSGAERHRISLTGFALADPLFDDSRITRPRAFDPERRHAVFAPHFSVTSAATQLGNFFADALEALPDDMKLAIWPHPDTVRGQPSWMDAWRRHCQVEPRLLLLDDAGVNPVEILAASDLLIADPSDRAALYLAVDRPLIVTGKRHTGDHALPEGVVGAIEQAAATIFEENALAGALGAAIADPEAMSEQRARARSIIFNSTADGRSAARSAEAVLQALAQTG